MFKDIKGGHVMISVGGKFKTVNIAVHSGVPGSLWAKTNGNWYTQLKVTKQDGASGKTASGYGWSHLRIPPTYNRIADTPFGTVQVESVAEKVKKRLGLKK
jgi:hypothetical protein